MKYYLAYGSNLNIRQMKMRCPGAKPVGTAILKDWRLLFKGSGSGSYLTIEPEKGSFVPVAIWQVSKKNEEWLDRYEGFPTFYYKKELPVTVGGKELEAFVYIMHEDRPIGLPSGVYMATCIGGYNDFGFDTSLLIKAFKNSMEVVS